MRSVLCSVVMVSVTLADRPTPAAGFIGDVSDVRVVRRIEQQPGAVLLWEPSLAQWKPKELVVAFGAGLKGKTDMGDVLVAVSTDDGDSWAAPVMVFDHAAPVGPAVAYANPILFKPAGQDACGVSRCVAH